ncbi:MAG: hypothetical protein Kow0059_18400 [Candidatus Sumerlaeia bacterium]
MTITESSDPLRKFAGVSAVAALGVLMAACSGLGVTPAPPVGPADETNRIETSAWPPPAPEYGFFKPRTAELEFVITISDVHVLDGEALRRSNRERGIPPYQKPTLLVWCAGPPELVNQRGVEWLDVSPEPTDTFQDDEHGNPIQFWDLSDRLTSGTNITLRRHFRFTTWEYRPLQGHQATAVALSDTMSPRLMSLYTRPEPFLQLTDEMRETARRAIGTETHPLFQAERLFEFVRGHMSYVYPPERRGALEALHSGRGDCGQYAYLFIALCRSLHIPARQQSGFRIGDDSIGYHVWAEIYLPPYGWIPVDATEKDGFGRLDNRRLVSSVGTHIPLRHAPTWATYANSDVEAGRTDFMQFMTIVQSGIEARITGERRIIRITGSD